MLMAALTFFAACSRHDYSWYSTSDFTVGMAPTAMTVNEGKGLFNVPNEGQGETNGNVFGSDTINGIETNTTNEDGNN